MRIGAKFSDNVCTYQNSGGEALSQVQLGDFPLFKYSGSVAFVLWRSVYLVKQVATKNRVLVTFDWIKSSLFGRDMTRF